MEKKAEKKFGQAEFMREQGVSLSDKLSKMSRSEILEYYKKKMRQSGIATNQDS